MRCLNQVIFDCELPEMASDLASALPGGSSQGCRQHELSAALDGF